jgi:hypothetical protein
MLDASFGTPVLEPLFYFAAFSTRLNSGPYRVGSYAVLPELTQ